MVVFEVGLGRDFQLQILEQQFFSVCCRITLVETKRLDYKNK